MTDKQIALEHYQAQAAQAKFEANPSRLSWDTYSTVARADNARSATYVTGEPGKVRLAWVEHRAHMSMDMKPEQARALAAELIAAADASQAAEVTQ